MWLGIKINLINYTIPCLNIKSIQYTIKKLPYTTAQNLSKLCDNFFLLNLWWKLYLPKCGTTLNDLKQPRRTYNEQETT